MTDLHIKHLFSWKREDGSFVYLVKGECEHTVWQTPTIPYSEYITFTVTFDTEFNIVKCDKNFAKFNAIEVRRVIDVIKRHPVVKARTIIEHPIEEDDNEYDDAVGDESYASMIKDVNMAYFADQVDMYEPNIDIN